MSHMRTSSCLKLNWYESNCSSSPSETSAHCLHFHIQATQFLQTLVFQHCIHRRNVLQSCKHNLKPGAIMLLLAQLCNQHFHCLLTCFWAATTVPENVTTFTVTSKQERGACIMQAADAGAADFHLVWVPQLLFSGRPCFGEVLETGGKGLVWGWLSSSSCSPHIICISLVQLPGKEQ